ncbi:MAG: formylglycine-generating enzyme family protein [Fibrobacterota bacterium]|nr:formylglycine-generating enzyme family protein [Fibrobacterota bacterium]
MCLKKALFWSCLCVILFACSDDPKGKNFNYLRSPSFFRADTAISAHPFCNETHPFASKEECLQAKKYHLTWTRPEDTAKLLGYRVYLDTTDPMAPAGKKWENVQGMVDLASIIIPYHSLKDSVVFVFGGSGFKQDTLKKGFGKIFVIDSVTREDGLTGNLDFALVPVYGGDVTPGKPQFSFFITRDKAPPDGFHPLYTPMATRIKVSWQRPTDRISFFDPSLDTGMIRGYYLKVELDGRKTDSRKKAFRPKLESFIVGGKDLTESVTDSLENDSLPAFIFFRLPDSNRASKRTSPTLEDSLFLVIGNLTPQDTLKLFLFAIDSAGNRNHTIMETISVLTTDTTQPSMPRLSVDSVSRNGFRVKWSASSDSIEVDGKKVEAEAPNANIHLYRLTRILQRQAGAKTTSLDRIDTTVEVDPSKDSTKDSLSISMRFLPPGTAFHLKLMAVDRSGFESATDTLTVTTDSVRFAGADSVLICPPGLIPVPRGSFKLGDAASSEKDEQSAKIVKVAPYCIEPYEHRDSTGKRFVSNVTYDKAAKICEDMAPDFDSKLCSEIEWERACEGPDSIPLLHGIQSEGANASILQSTCNQGTNDSAMAMSFELRNAICLTTEGVYDLAGNLSEWVRDPYYDSAYILFTKATTDTIDHDFTFGDSTMKRHGIRGGNYLKTNFPQQVLTQNLARCSNRDFPQQVRPVYKPECVNDDSAKVAIIYGPGLGGHRCVDLGALASRPITEIKPSAPRENNNRKLLVLIAGVATPDSLILPSDTAYNNRRPLSAQLTKRSLVEVVFERADGIDSIITDTLDASELRDTSHAALERIFKREAGSDEWRVRKVDGRFQIRFMYAYSVLGTKPAQPFYSSRVIGFRCCSRATIQVPVPTDTLPAVVTNP